MNRISTTHTNTQKHVREGDRVKEEKKSLKISLINGDREQ